MNVSKRNEAIAILKRLFSTKLNVCQDIYSAELVDTGKMTWGELGPLMSNPDLENVSDIVLCWLYEAVSKHSAALKIPDVSHFFTASEITEANSAYIKRGYSKLPIAFPILARLTDNDNYLTALSIQDIANLKSAGLIQWKEGMQRETVITKLSDNDFISHIKYDDNRARAIGKSMSDGTFFPNSLRWHIVADESDYEVKDDRVILKSGYIAEIDGQHRDKGSEYALMNNQNIIMTMPIVLTIGSRATAQRIINQDEERAPINKSVVAQYKYTMGNNVLKKIIGSGELDGIYKFCDTQQGIQVGQGFILKSDFAAAIDKYYSARTVKEQSKVAEWLIKFFNELASINYDAFVGYKKSISAKNSVFPIYVYLSSKLQNRSGWEDELAAVFPKLDFLNSKKSIEIINKEMGEKNV